MPDIEPGVPQELVTSSFAAIPFSWAPGGPQWERKDGLEHYSGEIVVYTPNHVSALMQRFRPVTITAAGDGLNVWVDYWGPDPSAALVILGSAVAQNAILVAFRQGQYQFRWVSLDPTADPPSVPVLIGVSRCQVDFIVTDFIPAPPPAYTTGPQPYIPMASSTVDTQRYTLWAEANPDMDPPTDAGNVAPPDAWQTLGFDSGDWPSAVQAETGGDLPFTNTQPVWWGPLPQNPDEIVLFRHTFSLPDGTISNGQLLVISNASLSIWFNDTEILSNSTPGSPGWAVPIDESLFAVGTNLLAIQANAGGDTAYVSYYLMLVLGPP